jgi:polyphosphate kinase 2 (PPK2 family)
VRIRYAHHSDTVILKFFLHISKAEQRRRLLERLQDPTKQWKFSEADLAVRRLWSRYQSAYEHVLTQCNTRQAPWHIIPANKKWYRNLAVAEIVVDAMRGLHSHYPPATLTAAARRRIRL